MESSERLSKVKRKVTLKYTPLCQPGLFEHRCVCMLPVFTVELGGVLCACVLERLGIAVASAHE